MRFGTRGVSLDYSRLFLLAIVLLVLVVPASFFVHGQETTSEEASDDSDEDLAVEEPAEESSSETEQTEEPSEETAGTEPSEEPVLVDDPSSDSVFVELEDVIPLESSETAEQQTENSAEASTSDETKKDVVFIDLDEIVDSTEDSDSSSGSNTETIVETEESDTSESATEATEEPTNEEPAALVPYVLFNNGMKEIETEIEEDRDLVISKEERLLSTDPWKKRVTVSSEEHFDRELTVYSDITPSEIHDVRVYWLQENRDMTSDTSFFDTDDDGLIDRVSFPVAHLSTQDFDIVVNFTSVETNSSTLELTTNDSPSGTITDPDSQLVYDFTVSYETPEAVLCDFLLENDEGTTTQENIGLNLSTWSGVTVNLTNDEYLWHMGCYDSNNLTINDSENGAFTIALDYTPQLSFTVNNDNIIEGDSATFTVNVTMLAEESGLYWVDFGDDDSMTPTSFDGDNLYIQIGHTYEDEGTFEASLSVSIDGDIYESSPLTITVENATFVDSEAPDITLINPANGETLDDELINFTYKATDDSPIDMCTFNLFYFNNTDVGELVYDTTENDPGNDEVIDVALIDFDEGDYTWEVECNDTLGNYDSEDKDFTYSLDGDSSDTTDDDSESPGSSSSDESGEVDFERKEEIESFQDLIKTFLIDAGKADKEEKTALDDLGATDTLVFYNKKISQIILDLGHNLDFIQDETARAQREAEIYAEIDDMMQTAILGISVVKSDEYVKNSVDSTMEDVVSSYVSSKNLILSRSAHKNLVEHNEQLQNDVTVSVTARHVELTYFDRTEKITLISKQPTVSEQSQGVFLEVIPKSVVSSADELTFIVEHVVIQDDPIIEVQQSDLENDKIVYYASGFVSLDDITSIDTLLFEETAPEGLGAFTGFSVLVDSATSGSFLLYFSWIIVIFVFVIGGFFAVRNMQLNTYKKRDDVRAMLGLVKDAERALTQKDLVRAKDNYGRVRDLYGTLPVKAKQLVFKRLNNLQVQIDKKETGLLIQECITALREGRKDDAVLIYNDIQLIYNRMPPKYKEKIREKMLPYLYMFKK